MKYNNKIMYCEDPAASGDDGGEYSDNPLAYEF